MSNSEQHNSTTRALTEAIAKFDEACRAMSGGPLSYYMDKVTVYVDALFTRFAPFKVGDRVALTRRPDGVYPSSHWWSRRDTLVAGCEGTVVEVDYIKDHFTAGVEIGINERAAIFHIEESALRKVSA